MKILDIIYWAIASYNPNNNNNFITVSCFLVYEKLIGDTYLPHPLKYPYKYPCYTFDFNIIIDPIITIVVFLLLFCILHS